MNIKETFLKLTSRTYPHNTEYELFDMLPQNLEMDEFGNLFIKIGESDVMFTSHLDTATSQLVNITHVFDGNLIKTDGKSILGADDKAGVTIMLNMIENKIPGLYYFFLGEEVGCVGSKKVSEKHKKEKLPYITKVISFDRRSTDSVITFQASSRCCSDAFGKALSEQLNLAESTFKYKNDPTGVYTDSAQFTKIYPECTNISVGYYSEHTTSERQDIDHLTKLAEACLHVNWTSLPVERDPSKIEYSSWDEDYYGYGWGYQGRSNLSTYKTYDDYKPVVVKDERVRFHDVKYDYASSYTISKSTGLYTQVDISKQRLQEEQMEILSLLHQIDLRFSTMSWDGLKLFLTHRDGEKTDATRSDVIEYLPQLDLVDLCVKMRNQYTYAYGDDIWE